jgi:hypothetical protein
VSVRRVLGLAFLGSVLIYGGLAQLLARGGEAVALPPFLTAALYLAALGALVAGVTVAPRLPGAGAPVVAMALAEVPAVTGLVLAILSKSPRDFYILGGSSFLALLYLTLREE